MTAEQEFNAVLGHTFRQVRKAKGLTQAVFAEKAGTTQAQVSLVESGKQSASIHTLRAFARVLEVFIVFNDDTVALIPAQTDLTEKSPQGGVIVKREKTTP